MASAILVDAPADLVWRVLVDPLTWVNVPPAGAIDVPAATVIETEPPTRLVLRAPAKGAASVRIELTLEETEGQTWVERREDVCGGGAGIMPDLVGQLLAEARLIWSLERLGDVSERAAINAPRIGAAPGVDTTPVAL